MAVIEYLKIDLLMNTEEDHPNTDVITKRLCIRTVR